jgi:hypothetical protein
MERRYERLDPDAITSEKAAPPVAYAPSAR